MALCMLLSFSISVGSGPYGGLIHDLVRPAQYGIASSWLGCATVTSTLMGTMVSSIIYDMNNLWPVYIFMSSTFAVFSLITIFGIPEMPRPKPKDSISVKLFFKQFSLNPQKYRNFFWVFATRFCMQVGMHSLLSYFKQYLMVMPGMSESGSIVYSAVLLAIIIVVSIPTSLVAGPLSDKWGRKFIVYFSVGILALSSILYLGCTWKPSVAAAFSMAAVVGIGYGAYQAVDWVLALDTLPADSSPGRDLGIWHFSYVVPHAVASNITANILYSLTDAHGPQIAYSVVFAQVTVWFLLAAAFLYPIDLPPPT